MITFKFEDLETDRKQDINCFQFPGSDDSYYISIVGSYYYNVEKSRIEFFGSPGDEYYYDHEEKSWAPFSFEDYEITYKTLECVEIVIK